MEQNNKWEGSINLVKAFFCFILVLFFCPLISHPVYGETPEIHGVTPTKGNSIIPTSLVISGENFESNLYVSLYGGGPYREGLGGRPGGMGIGGVYVQGNRAYLAAKSYGLIIMDITNPEEPQEIAVQEQTNALDVFVQGDYAYVADSTGLKIISINQPGYPIVGSCDTPYSARAVYVQGDYAYVADYNYLWIINISNPENPYAVGSYRASSPKDVFVQGSYVYLTDSEGLRIIDAGNPSNPSEIGSSDLEDMAGRAVYVQGDYAYVTATSATGGPGFKVVDIRNPFYPKVVGSCNLYGSYSYLFVQGDYAYVVDSRRRLQVIDISKPQNPTIVSTCRLHHLYEYPAGGLYIKDNYAYIGAGLGLQVIDISNSLNPSILASCDTPYECGFLGATESALDVYVDGNYVYVANKGSLQVIDVTDPAHPILIGSCDEVPSFVDKVFVQGNYAYLAWSKLVIVDISVPYRPQLRGFCNTDYARDVFVQGDYAYIAVGESGLQVIDVSDPHNPILVSTYDTPGSATGIFVKDDYAYIANGISFQIIDISDPLNPSLVQEYNFYADHVFVKGCYAYVVSSHKLSIVDICEGFITGSVKISIPESTAFYGIYVSENYAYITGDPGIVVIDVHNPYSPVMVGKITTVYTSRGIHGSGNYIYVADTLGIRVINAFKPCTNVNWINENEITADVPLGLAPGTYDLYVTNPGGEWAVLHNAFAVICLGDNLWNFRWNGDDRFHDNEPWLRPWRYDYDDGWGRWVGEWTYELKWSKTYTQPSDSIDGLDWNIDDNGNLHILADRDRQWHAWTYVYVSKSKNITIPADGDCVPRAFLNYAFDNPKEFPVTLKLQTGWNRIDITGYNQNDSYAFDLNYFLASNVDVMNSSPFSIPTIPGDVDGDNDVDREDLNILLSYRNQPASVCPECDLDGDGIITVLDARKLVLLCTRPRCACE